MLVAHKTVGNKIVHLPVSEAARRQEQNQKHRAWRDRKHTAIQENKHLKEELKRARGEAYLARINKPNSKERIAFQEYTIAVKARLAWYEQSNWFVRTFCPCPVKVPDFKPIWWSLE